MVQPGDIPIIYVRELLAIKGKFNHQRPASLGLKSGPKHHEYSLEKSVPHEITTKGRVINQRRGNMVI